MCIRYNGIDARWERYIRRKQIWVPIPLPQTKDSGLFPGDIGAIIRPDPEHGRELVVAKWGLQSPFAKAATSGKRFCYNARAEGSEERCEGIDKMRSYAVPFARWRCVVPAASFYERVGPEGEQHWIRVRRADDEPLLLAGLWSPPNEWTEQPTFTIVTTAPPPGYIHDRIPVILEDGLDTAWMSENAPLDGLRALMVHGELERLVVEDFEPVVYREKKPKAERPLKPSPPHQETLF